MTGIWIVDAFTKTAFGGNPAGVCLLDAFPDDSLMQRVAMEMNLSETAFVVQTGELAYHIRWFTPTVEVNLCGHATLAATHVLSQAGALKSGQTVTYDSLSGPLKARLLEDGIELDLPELAGTPKKAPAALKALNVPFTTCELNRDNYLVEVADYQILLDCKPDFRKLAKMDAQGVIVTCKGPEGYDFASRYFGPNCGIDEDPVTGSAHCFLAPYWAPRLNKTHFRAQQASRRRGELKVRMEKGRVYVTGNAVTTLKGELTMSLARATKGKAA